jgi:hypothetical protein
MLPPLEELRLQGLLFTEQDVEYRKGAMDWSHVKVLDLSDLTFSGVLTPAAEHLPSLEILGIWIPPKLSCCTNLNVSQYSQIPPYPWTRKEELNLSSLVHIMIPPKMPHPSLGQSSSS